MSENMKTISFSIEEGTAAQAERIYRALGLDMQAALRMFVKRTVFEGGLPLSQVPRFSSRREVASAPPVKEGKVSPDMLECLWSMIPEDGSIESVKDLASRLSELAGMNLSTAKIYVSFCKNLLSGQKNVRTIKMGDLRWLLDKVRTERPASVYEQAAESLKASLANWGNPRYGKYASHVRDYLEEHPVL